MSKNLVDVSIEISDKFNLPLTLIATEDKLIVRNFQVDM